MNKVLTEKQYQQFILERLSQDNGYVIRPADQFDRLLAMDKELLFTFLQNTQPDTWTALRKIYKEHLEETLANTVNNALTSKSGGLLNLLKHGLDISNYHLDFMYTKPATAFNPQLLKKYEQNIFSVMEEVWASDAERVDLVVFLNGLPVLSFELKCNAAGQSYQDAIYQYRAERNPKTR